MLFFILIVKMAANYAKKKKKKIYIYIYIGRLFVGRLLITCNCSNFSHHCNNEKPMEKKQRITF